MPGVPTISGIGAAREMYERGFTHREPFLQRARDASRITIPHLMPEIAADKRGTYAPLSEPFQSIGARGVNNMTARMQLVLFPVNTKFFRMQVDRSAVVNLEQFRTEKAEIEESLSEIEDMVLDEFEEQGLRTKIFEAIRQVVCCGNALIHLPQNRKARVFRLDSYVVERDPRGNLITIITHQQVSRLTLDQSLQKKVSPDRSNVSMAHGGYGEDWLDVYTVVQLQRDKTWKEWQEIDGVMVDRVTTHAPNRLPYIALRMYATDGEDYGRGHVEEYMGDLRTLEGLREAMVDAALAASKVVPMVNPDGVTRIKSLREAPNGQYISGVADDVSFLQLDKFADLRVVAQEIEGLKRDLGLAFLLNSTVQRNAERVTAEEIRLVAQELEDTLGGTFSLLSADLQMPLVTNLLGNLQDKGAVPELPDLIKPVIITGLEAIGRGHDLARMKELFRTMQEAFGPQSMAAVDLQKAWKMAATALGVDTEALLKTEEQISQDNAQAGLREGLQQLGPAAIKEFPEEIRAAMAAQSGAQAPTQAA